MTIPTEAIGSIPRSPRLLEAIERYGQGRLTSDELQAFYDDALKDTIFQLEATGSPVISDGEQTKSSFATYPLLNLTNVAADGIIIPFADGHTRQLPKLVSGPFKYGIHAGAYVKAAKRYASKPIKQAVISASALSLLYPPEGIPGYPRDIFIDDLIREAVADIRSCFDAGAYLVQIDFTEGRLSVKLDPSKHLLREFVALNNRVLAHFSSEEKKRIGVHTCPGSDIDCAHSADVDYAELIPDLFKMDTANVYMQLASEKDPESVLRIVKSHTAAKQRVYVGVIDVLNPAVESPEQVCDRILLAAEYITLEKLGTTDDCGFSPFEDDTSTGRETAFAKIRARVVGTALAAKELSR